MFKEVPDFAKELGLDPDRSPGSEPGDIRYPGRVIDADDPAAKEFLTVLQRCRSRWTEIRMSLPPEARYALRGPVAARLGGQAEALVDQVGDRAGHGVSAARVIVVVSRLCHSEAAKASLIFSSGYLCERMRLQG